MASSTTNLDLILPVGGENVSRQIINANNVKIDEAVGPVPSGTNLQSEIESLNNKITNRAFNVYASITGSGTAVNRLETGWDTLWTNAKTATGTDSGIIALSGTIDFPANGNDAAIGTYYFHGDINLSNKAGIIYLNQYHNDAPFYVVLRHPDGTYNDDQMVRKSELSWSNVTLTASQGTITNYICKKNNNSVFISLEIKGPVTAYQNFISGFPAIAGMYYGEMLNSDASVRVRSYIQTDGQWFLRANLASDATIRCSLVAPLNV